ncbi:purine nucleobase transmembrane transporter [Aureococcus anophagefferens]|nr:purine nucleobase transmembrane transporter [Aureococcus anophagefferens]
MDAEAGVALTETEKEKTIADEPPVATDAITIGLAQERPERAFLENPIAWWGDTPWLLWNKEYGGILGLWTGSGERRRSASSSSTTSRRSSP